MIGDWVNVMKKDSYEPVRVCTIYENAIDYLYIDNSLSTETTALGMITIAGVEPIPLTPEILEKNFEKKALWGIYDDYYDFTIREWNGMFIVNYHYCEIPMPDTQIVGISYVHELQHALRMCGIEKEIII